MTIDPQTPLDGALGDPERDTDPDPEPDKDEHGLAGRDADQAYVDQEMADGKRPSS